jgi:hypothetical protein
MEDGMKLEGDHAGAALADGGLRMPLLPEPDAPARPSAAGGASGNPGEEPYLEEPEQRTPENLEKITALRKKKKKTREEKEELMVRLAFYNEAPQARERRLEDDRRLAAQAAEKKSRGKGVFRRRR